MKTGSYILDRKCTETLHPRFIKGIISGGLELTLHNNTFQFDNNCIQTQGTVIRAKIATTNAILI